MKKISLVIAFCLATTCMWAQFGGSGTANDPYAINDTMDLAELARRVNNGMDYEGQYFRLTADLDLSDWDNGDQCGWVPIGTDYQGGETMRYPFRGIFDGNYKTISGLTINRPEESGIGLFGCIIRGAEIKNLSLINVNIVGDINVGGLIGHSLAYSYEYTKASTNNCVTGRVSGNYNVGGLIGKVGIGDVIESYTTCSVDGKINVGGLVGYADDHSRISRCYAMGQVNGNQSVGGLIGYLYTSNISNCYAVGQVNGTDSVGGLVGYATYGYDSTHGRIESSLSINPKVTGKGYNVNRIVGFYENGALDNNYANVAMLVNGRTVSDGDENGVGKHIAELQAENFYTNGSNWYNSNAWSLQSSHTDNETWNLWEGKSFPYFQWQAAPAIFTGTDNVSGIYRMDDGQTTDSLVFYLNGSYHSSIISPNGEWLFGSPVSEDDTLTVLVYEFGQMVSVVDITGVSNTVSNQLIRTTNKIWAAGGRVFMCVEQNTQVHIYNLSGVLVRSMSVAAGETHSIPLSTGAYIVKASDQSYKVLVTN